MSRLEVSSPHPARRLLSPLAAAIMAVVLACDGGTENTGPGPDPGGCEHVDNASGVELRVLGAQVYRQFAAQTTGSIVVMDGGSVPGIEAAFLDATGGAIPISNDCAINELRFQVEDPSVVDITRPPGQRWFFNVVAKVQGTTTIRVLLWHDNHAHFRSEPIPVTVVP